MKHCPSVECPHYRAVGTPAEYVTEVATCADCGARLEDGLAPAEATQDRSIAPALARRLGATLLVIPVLFVLQRIALPGVDADAMREQLAKTSSLLDVASILRPYGNLSVAALGVTPIVSAAILVGLGMLAVPRFRDLGRSAAGRRQIRWAMLLLTVVLCAFQGYGIARLLSSLPDVYSGSAPVVVLTLTAGTMLLVGVADLLTRYGVANGFSVLIGWSLFSGEIEGLARYALARRDAPLLAGHLFLLVAVPVAAAYAIGRLIAPPRDAGSAQAAERPAAYRIPGAPAGGEPLTGRPSFVRLLASGVWPVGMMATVLTPLSSTGILSGSLRDDSLAFGAAYAGGVIAITVVLAYVMHVPQRVERARRGGAGPAEDEAAVRAASADVRTAAVRSAALVGAAVVGCLVARQALGHFPSATNLFLLTAIGLDLIAEWRARRAGGELATVLSEHDVDAADAAARALVGAGIPVLERGVHHRSMLQIFGSYVPIELLVPAGHAAEAQRIVARFAPAADPQAAPEPEAAPRRKKRRRDASRARA